MPPETVAISRRAFVGLAAVSGALAACTTGESQTEPRGSWTRSPDGRVVISDPGVHSYSVTMPPGWDIASGAPPGAAAVQVAPREGGVAVELGIARAQSGEAPEKTALRVAQRVAPATDPTRAPEALAPIPLQSGGGRRAQVYSIPQRGGQRVVVVALIAESGVWAYQLLYAASRVGYDRGMPLMRNLVASYRRA
ncbi:MAG TPA: twin-arginine translocation signal domain-containing protein [Vineibacter sp.]|nr:twin-arginine translocation signal domain-containing protein [Vineibacter sp.]